MVLSFLKRVILMMKLISLNLRQMKVCAFAVPQPEHITLSFLPQVESNTLLFAEQVIEGLDRAVITMKKGEVSTLSIAPEYAFGSSESKQELATVPPNSTVYYDIELVSFVKVVDDLRNHCICILTV